jgi:hypothetical protein
VCLGSASVLSLRAHWNGRSNDKIWQQTISELNTECQLVQQIVDALQRCVGLVHHCRYNERPLTCSCNSWKSATAPSASDAQPLRQMPERAKAASTSASNILQHQPPQHHVPSSSSCSSVIVVPKSSGSSAASLRLQAATSSKAAPKSRSTLAKPLNSSNGGKRYMSNGSHCFDTAGTDAPHRRKATDSSAKADRSDKPDKADSTKPDSENEVPHVPDPTDVAARKEYDVLPRPVLSLSVSVSVSTGCSTSRPQLSC